MLVCFTLLMDTISAHTSVRAEPIESSGGDVAIKERMADKRNAVSSRLINKNSSNPYMEDPGG